MHHHRIFFRQYVLGNLFAIHDSKADQNDQENHFYFDPAGFLEHPCVHRQENSRDEGHSQYGVVDEFVDARLGFFQTQRKQVEVGQEASRARRAEPGRRGPKEGEGDESEQPVGIRFHQLQCLSGGRGGGGFPPG